MEDDLFSTVLSELKSLGVKIPKIKKLKSNVSKQNSQEKATGNGNKIFGVNLHDQEWIYEDGIALPKFVSQATKYLRQSASNEVGLFRKGGSISRQKELRLKLENGESFEKSEPNDIASLLKQWLRELPEPLIPVYLHELFIRCLSLDEDNQLTAILLSCHLLPAEHLQTLKYLLFFLADIAANCKKNKMDFHNLSVIMAPNIFVIGSETIDKSSNNVVQLYTSLMQILIENAEKVGVFPNVRGAQICSESELSSDMLDLSPKSKRKRRSGKVQDIFSGIRKLVGQNPSPVASRKETPDKSQSNRSSVSRSASKRKAEGDQQSISAKKQAVLRTEWKNFALKSTPEGKTPTRASYKEGSRSTASSARNSTNCKKSEKEPNEIRRNSSRKGSIVRGRPNTVKSGLPRDLNIRLSNESMLSAGNKTNKDARISSGSEVSLEFNTEKSLLKVNIASELNVSGNNEVGCLPFSPITSNSFFTDNSCLKTPNAKICDSIFKDEDSNINLEMDVNQNSTGSKRSKKGRLRMSSNSDSKIRRGKNSLKISRTNSFPNPAKNKLELSSISQALNEVLTIDNAKENLNISSDSCFIDNKKKEAPENIEVLKENAETWVSGEKFLEKIQHEEEIFNKRESIAMILRNKSGHVQAKVSLYDRHVRNPTHSTPNASKVSTPLNVCHRTYSLRNEIPLQNCTQNPNELVRRNASENRKLQISNGYDSTPRFKNKTKSIKTPLPPPPKFNDCDLSFASPIVSYPLKEVTNLSSKVENSIAEKSDSITPMKIKDEDIFQTQEAPSPIKQKRNSFSDRGPHKTLKVSRSESSPVIFKKRKQTPKPCVYRCSSLANALKDQRVSSNKEHSLVFETGSALSFENLKSDQMLDEWQYEM
ncbi:rho GTPase-activating protein 24-like [Uloborus diversus]|uniref:rho GTPase-activating protein 24-like n=1 Tax=Uloborus diversus TaxID=327109 RepID=UPI002409494E|nr:rho GTPase-activating protein 24-like [Uloborus diversus]